jgi:branched-chain amino acid transport system ATP-binding protein
MTDSAAEIPIEGHPVLEVEHVTAGYGDTVVLRDVSLRVADASVVALLGPNGAGKTTLLRTAAGFIRATRGSIRFDGEDVTGAAAHVMARKGLCLLPEGRGIFPSLSVRDNLLLQSPKGEERASIERAVELFPILGTRIGQTAGSLSGGEQQMLALVRASVSNPKLVVVDEASLGLAPLVVDKIFDTLRQIVATGTSLLLVEQYVTRALDIADRVYLLNRGQIVFSGAADELEGEDVFERYLGIDVGS